MWTWPDWVPGEVCHRVEDHFASPIEWQSDAVMCAAPLLGDYILHKGKLGRFVHRSGSIGFWIHGRELLEVSHQVQWRVVGFDQPYATALALGLKCNETRGQRSHYRGKLIIHANAKPPLPQDLEAFQTALDLCQAECPDVLKPQLALGRVVGVTDMVNCHEMVTPKGWPHIPPNGSIDPAKISEVEELLGHWEEGRFAWAQEHPRDLPAPLPWKGKQGWQHPSFELLLQIRKQLEGVGHG